MANHFQGSVRKVNLTTGEFSMSDFLSDQEAILNEPLSEEQIELVGFSEEQGETEVGDTVAKNYVLYERLEDGWKPIGYIPPDSNVGIMARSC
jgi:hypothetical protein